MRAFAPLLLAAALGPAAAAVVTFDYMPLNDYSKSLIQTGGVNFAVSCVGCMGVEGRGFGDISLDNLVVGHQVPEPESAGLALLALVGAGAASLRRQRV